MFVTYSESASAPWKEIPGVTWLIPSHIRSVFAPVHVNGATLDKDRLLTAMQTHEGFVEGEKVPSTNAASGGKLRLSG